MLHNHKESISTIAVAAATTQTTTTTIITTENDTETGNKGIISLTRRPTLEQSNLIAKQRAKNEEHVLATNNNYSNNNLTASICKRKNTNGKAQMLPFIQKSQKLLLQQQQELNENDEKFQHKNKMQEETKLHNNQPLIANIEHLSYQTHAHTHTHAHTSSNTRPILSAYSQPYATPPNYMHTTNTLSTFKGKNSSGLSRNSHYFSSLDNRSQRHQQQKQQQEQHQQQQHYIQNYQQYRQKKRKQTYDSLMPYSVANLPILQKSNSNFSSDGSSEDGNETVTTAMPCTPINKSGTAHYHMSHHKMQQQQQQQQQHMKQDSKDNHCHYISPNQAKSSFQQQQQQIDITSFKQNKRNKLQNRHLPNSQQERT